jgi:Holliday junction resolvasome RuvABC ATP-dependent DNA helicase subunit
MDELIGLEDAKEQIAVWGNESQIDQILAEQGDAVTSSDEDHVVFLGPPGAAKTTFGRAVGDVLFGLARSSAPTSRRSPKKTTSSATYRRPPRE